MAMYCRRLLLSLLLFLTIPLSANDSTKTDTISLQLKWKHSFQFAGFYMAKEKGLYADAGLDVSVKEIGSEVDLVADVLSGRSTYAISDSALILDRMQGADVVALSAILQRSPVALMVLSSSGIEKVEDLQGKRVMIDSTSAQNVSIMAMLKSRLGEATFDIVPMSYDIDELIKDRVDAFTVYIADQPMTLEARGIKYRLLDPTTHGFDFYGDMLFTSSKELSTHPRRVKKFVDASTKGWEYAFDHIDETIEVILRHYDSQGLSAEKLRKEALVLKALSKIDLGVFGELDPIKIMNIANIFAVLGMAGDQERLHDFIFRPEQIVLKSAHKEFLAEHPQIKVSCMSHLEPLEFTSDGSCQGFSPDLVRLIADKVGLDVVFEPYDDHVNIHKALLTRDIDIMQLASDLILNRFYATLSSSYFDINTVIVTQKSRDDIHTIDDLTDKRVALLKDSLITKGAKLRYPTTNIVEFDNVKSMLEAVAFGKVDAMVNEHRIVTYMMHKHAFGDLKITGRIDTSKIIQELSFGIRNDWPILNEIFDEALNTISEEEILALEQEWFHKYLRPDGPTEHLQLKFEEDEKSYLQEKKKLTMCLPSNIPPFVIYEEDKLSGMAGDYVGFFEERMNIRIEPVASDNTSDYIRSVIDGDCDLYIVLQKSPRFKDLVLLTKPYFDDPLVIVTKVDEPFIPDLHAIDGKKVGAIQGTVMKDAMENSYPELDMIGVESIYQALNSVLNGELYGFVYPMVVLNHMVQTEYPGQLRISGRSDKRFSGSIGVRKDDPILHEIFEKVILDMTPDIKNNIYAKWVSVKYERGYDYALLWKVAAAFTLLLIIVLFWNRRLIIHRREIDAKNQELEAEKLKVDHIAYHDHLTGLSNRVALSRILEHAINVAHRRHDLLGLLFIDLDRFKIVNDTLGHHVGDEMLKVVAKRLESVIRDADVLARVGGDEFIVLLEGMKHQDEAALVSEKILKSIKEQIHVDEYELNTTASIGIALYPDDGEDINSLIKNADSAMYLAKAEGKDSYRYYTKHLSDEVHERLTLEHYLRHALEKDEFSLVFQPQYDLATHKIIAAEALLRWDRHERDVITPNRFIPIAEDSGVILAIGEWVFINACKEFLKWRSLGLDIEQISINVSSVQFNQEDVVEHFKTMIEEVGIEAGSVELEITERYVMEHTKQNQDILDELRDIGFKISIDDFGTGYSSMSYLKTLPLDTIKIDKSFIDDIPHGPNDVAITKAILVLAKSLEYTVVAEGIENIDQEHFLKTHQCDIGQGYLFSRPLTPQAFIAFCSRS